MAVDHVGQRDRHPAVARRLSAVLLVRGQFRQVQRDLRFVGRRHRLHDMALDFSNRDPPWRRDRCRDGAPDRARHYHGITRAHGHARGADGGYRGRCAGRLGADTDDQPARTSDLGRRGTRLRCRGDPALKHLQARLRSGAARLHACQAVDGWPYLSVWSTKAADGDPLDILVIHDFRTYPGVVLRCTPVGILEFEQKSNGPQRGEERSRLCGAGLLSARDRPKGHPPSSSAGTRRTGAVFPSDQRARE